jgi:ferric-dicitrate binding protein FerR (iron transport regulator)
MTHDPLVDVTRLLSESVRDVGDVGTLPEARNEAIAKLEDALRAHARARRRRRLLGVTAVAAAVFGVIGGGLVATRHEASVADSTDLGRLQQPAGDLTLERDGHPSALGAAGLVPEGTELRTPTSSEARLDFLSGTRLVIGGGTRVRLIEQSKRKRFALEAGSLSAKVAKLGRDERFVVTTSDSEIEVHGTEFRVSLVAPDPTCGGGTPTRLEVTEGVVAIRQSGKETLVAAGEVWPRCQAVGTAAPLPQAPEPARDSRPAAVHAGSSAQPPVAAHPAAASQAPVTAGSTPLAEQNGLYGRAMQERHEGRLEAAVVSLDRLITTYPEGPLSESARLQRMRILATIDRGRAASAASDYLQRHPTGFGRAEAEVLVSGPP